VAAACELVLLGPARRWCGSDEHDRVLSMLSKTEVIAEARKLAAGLELDMVWTERHAGQGYWLATSRQKLSAITARTTAGLDLLRQYSGSETFWTRRAVAAYDSQGDHQSTETGARAVEDLLSFWCDQLEAGAVELAGEVARRELDGVSTDVMSIVRRLLEDPKSHPAPPMVMCGAALEIALRAVASAHDVLPDGPTTMSGLTAVLRRAELLTKQEVKDLEMLGGLRNSAAHGHFEDLSMERAGLMEQHSNLMLRRLADLHP